MNFGALKKFKDWYSGDGETGLRNIINNIMACEKSEMGAHIRLALAGHLVAVLLYQAFIENSSTWWC